MSVKMDKLEAVSRLQLICAEVFDEVTALLRMGMSEVAIAGKLQTSFANRGITEHWYDVPFVVLIGTDRFIEGLTTSNYEVKAPSEKSLLLEGSPLHIDFAPMDPETKLWGDWSRTVVFRPRPGLDNEEVAFLQEVRQIQQDGISRITAKTTGAEVAVFFLDAFNKRNILLVDVRDNVGHSMHAGPKSAAQRVWLDEENTKPLGEGVFTIEPGGSRLGENGAVYVARFEDCIYIPPAGSAVVLGGAKANFIV